MQKKSANKKELAVPLSMSMLIIIRCASNCCLDSKQNFMYICFSSFLVCLLFLFSAVVWTRKEMYRQKEASERMTPQTLFTVQQVFSS